MASSSSKMIKAGLIGAGNISEFHVRALKRLNNVSIVGVADIDETRARDLAKQYDLPASFSSLDDLLREGPDVVHVLTPPSAHAENVIKALKHGCHVMVEKPLATSVEDCDRIAEAAKSADKLVCVDHSLLRDPFVVQALEIVRSGAIGDVVSVDHLRSEFYEPYRGGRLPDQYRDGGFPFRDIGVHSLYMLEALLGKVQDATLQLGSLENDGCPRCKEWRVLAQCERGIGHVYLSWNVSPLQNVFIIHGTQGVIRADIVGMSVTARKKGRLPGAAERILNSVNEGRRMMTQVTGNVLRVLRKKLLQNHGLQILVGDFYEAIAAKGDAPVSVSDARNVIDWTERIATQADREKEAYSSRFAQTGTAKILLTGATGFIGNHLLKGLLKDDQRARILVRRTPSAEIVNNSQVETFLGDLGNAEDVDRAMQGIEKVYHLGATVEGWAEEFQCGTIVGTQNIVDSCLKHGVEKLIYMSSLSVIDAASAARNGKPVKEDFPFEPHPDRRGLYTQTKLDAEHMVTEAVKSSGLRAVILRPGEVMGPDKLFLSGAVGREAAGRVIVLGGGKSVVPLIWVEDLVDAILAAAKSDVCDGAAFTLVDPEEVTQDELARHYLQARGQKPRLAHFPLFALYPAALGLKIALGLLGKQSPITPYRLSSALGSRRFDCTAAKQQLGWEPRIGIRAGLATMLESAVT